MRSCLFCDQQASTREDAWPIWLMNRFPVPSTARMFAERRGGQLRDWALTKARLIVKWLCGACNNGWMSHLESQVKPIIESILDDKLTVIDASAQSTLALWAVKTAMVLEPLDPNPSWFYSPEERDQMRVTRSLPQRTSVWIAKCVNQPDIYSAAKDLRTSHGKHEVRAFAVTMAFGSLAFQVVTVKASPTIPDNVTITYDVRHDHWDHVLVQVWPPSHEVRTWPPTHGLNGDGGLHALTERLNPGSSQPKVG